MNVRTLVEQQQFIFPLNAYHRFIYTIFFFNLLSGQIVVSEDDIVTIAYFAVSRIQTTLFSNHTQPHLPSIFLYRLKIK